MIKIPVDKQQRLYELTFLLPVDFTEAELATETAKITKLITKHQGEILQTEDWGKRQLAYKIKHRGKMWTEAVYTQQVVQFPPEKIKAFEQELLLEEVVLRHLLVVSQNQDLDHIQPSANQRGDQETKLET